MIRIGSDAEESLRMRQLDGASTAGWLMRSTSTITAPLSAAQAARWRPPRCERAWRPIAPDVDVSWSSELPPLARNDGPLWAGRGYSTQITGGVRAQCGPVRARLAPTVWYTENVAFLIAPSTTPGRSSFAAPLHTASPFSGDIPQRFGTQSLLVVDPGETSIAIDAGPVTVSATTESQWWGPALRTALVMSNHASGIPRVELATRRPLSSPAGAIEAKWMIGALTESPYFDYDANDDLRSVSGLVVSLRPAFDTNLTLGGARVVYAAVPGAGALPARALDVFARWGPGSNVRNATPGRGAEQLTELFARWVLPRSRAEVYTEWARIVLPASLRSLLIAPQETQGYTAGMQWMSASMDAPHRWRTQVEVTQLEQDYGTTASFYVSPTVAQGYTQRGQVVGAAIGTGANSQFIAVDRFDRGWRIGGLAGRVRWDNDAYYRQPTSVNGFAHDVSVYAGLRVGYRLGRADISGEIVAERRMNYLYQSACAGYCIDDAFDVHNLSFRFTASPRF